MNMSGGEVPKIDIDIDTVHNCIEQCLKLYMSQEEAANTLFIQKNIQPQITELVWERLEQQNQDFFKGYYLMLMVKDQIEEFNKLLAEQVDLMRRTGLVPGPSMPVPNGSNISPRAVQQAHHAGENPVQQFSKHTNDMQTPMLTNLPNAFMNHGPTINPCIQSSQGMSVHGKGMDVPSNMLLAQSPSMGIRPTPNGVAIKRETDYPTSSFNYPATSNFVGSHSAMADPVMSPFSSANSSLLSLNGSILDNDASSFGFLSQLSQNFSVPNMASEISTNPDTLNGYSETPFLASSSNNIFYPRGNMGRFG